MCFPSASDKNWPGLMRNDDLTDSVTGDWRQPGAPGAEEGAADAASALKEVPL